MLPTRRAVSRWIAGIGLVTILGLGLAACGDGGTSAARQACAHIHTSLALYQRSTTATDPSKARQLTNQAEVQLSDALGLAAQAASENGQWQALSTTLSEQGRVPESSLVTALNQQCTEVDSSNADEPPPPSNIPPPTTTTTTRP